MRGGIAVARSIDSMGTTVEEVMTPDPLTLLPTATVGDAFRLMKERGFRHVPIVEADVLLGVISMTDIGHLGAGVAAILERPLHEVMSKKLITVKQSESIAAAATMMASKKINCLLVTENRRLIGIVTTYDLLDALARRVRTENQV
jgi:acetoin utilization protein AcuB